MASSPPVPTRVFCAYEFSSPRMEFYEELKRILSPDFIDLYLPHLDYQPTMIWSRIRPEINAAQLIIVDAEYSNPNVAFECGYAISQGVHPILIKHHDSTSNAFPFLRAFQRIDYYSRADLIHPITELVSRPHWRSLLPHPMDEVASAPSRPPQNAAPDTHIYLLAVRARQDPVLRLKRELNRRPYSLADDAIESPSQFSTRDIMTSLHRFSNIAIHLVGDLRAEPSDLLALNSAAAFFAGIAHGLGKAGLYG